MSKIGQSGRSSLRRPKLPIKGVSAPEEEYVVGTADAMASDNRCSSQYDSTTLVMLCGIPTPQEDRVCEKVSRPSS